MKLWKSDDELFALARRELYTAVAGDIMDLLLDTGTSFWFIREVCVNLTAGKLEFGFMQAVEFENKEGLIPLPVGLALRAS